MIVEDVHGYAVMIRDQFRQAYEPSTPVSVAPKLGGWPKGTPDEHRFSEDFFATLPRDAEKPCRRRRRRGRREDDPS